MRTTLIGRSFTVTLLLIAGCRATGSASASGGGVTGSGGAIADMAGGTTGAGAPGTGGAAGGAATAVGTAGGGTGRVATADGAVASPGWLTPPPIPPALVVPAGAKLKLHVHGVGAQIYTCTAAAGAGANSAATIYSWVFKAPDAKLYDATGVQVGTHGAGPTWTSNDGSVATGKKLAELPSPFPDAISWLLLRVSATTGAGLFGDVSYVQRLSTTGGQAPATGCDSTAVGMDLRVSYTAEYYFFTGGAGAAWLAPPTDLPSAIATPLGLAVKLHDRGIGVQIYACLTGGGGDSGGDGGADASPASYAWMYQAPDATLFDEDYQPVATLAAGLTWTSGDGSVLVTKLLAEVASPLPDAFPWLLLKNFSTDGAGELDDVAVVQQVNTAGGEAPESGCDPTTVNTLARVAYSADYYFSVSSDQVDDSAG